MDDYFHATFLCIQDMFETESIYIPLLLDDEECCYALPVLCLSGSDKHPVHDGEFKLHGNMIHS